MGIDPDAVERFQVVEKQLGEALAKLESLEALPQPEPALLDQLNAALFDAVAKNGDAETVLRDVIAYVREL